MYSLLSQMLPFISICDMLSGTAFSLLVQPCSYKSALTYPLSCLSPSYPSCCHLVPYSTRPTSAFSQVARNPRPSLVPPTCSLLSPGIPLRPS